MKNKVIWIIIFGIVCIICFFFIFKSHNGNIAVIKSDGKIIREIDLNKVSTPYDLTVEYNNHSNIIHIEHNNISVIHADCPDKLCVNQGKISDSSVPIVCLPNRLTITIKSGKLDAVASSVVN